MDSINEHLVVGLAGTSQFLFLFNGVNHFFVPSDLPPQMAWMYDLSGNCTQRGTVEVLAGLGLILPGSLASERLTWLAALGLVLVMVGAAVWHIPATSLRMLLEHRLRRLGGFRGYGR